LVLQADPIPDSPQLPEVKSQAWTPLHCSVALQVSKQSLVVVSHVYGRQSIVAPGRHWPLPSHVSSPTTALPLHIPC
jgi:hypothetical protein